MTGQVVRADDSIEIGNHVTGSVGGWTFNLDTIWSTVIVGAIVIGLGFLARRAITKESDDHVPTKVQLFWEGVVKEVNTQVEDNLGKVHPFVAPLAIALFVFILLANWLEIIPSEPGQTHYLPAPTSDANLTYAMAILVMVSVWIYGARRHGLVGYLKSFYGQSIFPEKRSVDTPTRIIFTFLNAIEEIVKPLTLSLRLFGNIFAGGIMIALIGLLPLYVPVAGGDIIWKLFDMFIGAIQAFIFALLTVIYFGMATSGHGAEETHAEDVGGSGEVAETPPDNLTDPRTDESRPVPQPAS